MNTQESTELEKKKQVIMAYMDSDFKDLCPYMTVWICN